MHFLNYFYNKKLKFDLINKFYYNNLKKLPKLRSVILNFHCKTTELKTLATNLLALELITSQKGILTVSKKPSLVLKIRKGNPTGCKLTLKKTLMLSFFSSSANRIFPKLKNFDGIDVSLKVEKTALSYTMKNMLDFAKLSEHYYLFNNLSNLDISIVATLKTKKEILFLLKALQLPLKF